MDPRLEITVAQIRRYTPPAVSSVSQKPPDARPDPASRVGLGGPGGYCTISAVALRQESSKMRGICFGTQKLSRNSREVPLTPAGLLQSGDRAWRPSS